LVLEKRKENHCRRSGGTWHHWKLFKAEWKGELKRSEEETKQAAWFDTAALHELADHTKKYLAEETSEPEWQENPGLEPVMYEFLKELKII
ncbi:MAG: NUDIX hydrolase, partial [Patescibacteria group bacterium]|nr:NUDIX hydrolase [Patescibacteria group bacterium]